MFQEMTEDIPPKLKKCKNAENEGPSRGQSSNKRHLQHSLPWWLRCKSVCLQCGRPGFDSWVEKIPLEKEMATHSSTPAWKISWMDGGAWWAVVHGVPKSWTQLRIHIHFQSSQWKSAGIYNFIRSLTITMLPFVVMAN